MRFGVEDLRDLALTALEEAAEQSTGGRRLERRSKAIAFALAYLCAYGGERGMFDWFWKSLASDNDIGRSSNVRAALNGIYRVVGLTPP